MEIRLNYTNRRLSNYSTDAATTTVVRAALRALDIAFSQ